MVDQKEFEVANIMIPMGTQMDILETMQESDVQVEVMMELSSRVLKHHRKQPPDRVVELELNR